MKTSSQKQGKSAEDLAVKHLQKMGFSIIERNYRYERAEVDIIAKKNTLLVFVEVKARSNHRFGHPEEFVTCKQQDLIHAAAEDYILAQNWGHAVRFDIISIFRSKGQAQLTHFEDAF